MFYNPPQDMQKPTHSRLHVRDARDAHTVFEAVRQGFLKPVERRLNEVERSMYIRSGSIFVWEESEDDLGLKRWTDGRVWSQSRMREVSCSLFQEITDTSCFEADFVLYGSRISSMTKNYRQIAPQTTNLHGKQPLQDSIKPEGDPINNIFLVRQITSDSSMA